MFGLVSRDGLIRSRLYGLATRFTAYIPNEELLVGDDLSSMDIDSEFLYASGVTIVLASRYMVWQDSTKRVLRSPSRLSQELRGTILVHVRPDGKRPEFHSMNHNGG